MDASLDRWLSRFVSSRRHPVGFVAELEGIPIREGLALPLLPQASREQDFHEILVEEEEEKEKRTQQDSGQRRNKTTYQDSGQRRKKKKTNTTP